MEIIIFKKKEKNNKDKKDKKIIPKNKFYTSTGKFV
jgi:hypothetical protein